MNLIWSGGKIPIWALENAKVNRVREIRRIPVMDKTEKEKRIKVRSLENIQRGKWKE